MIIVGITGTLGAGKGAVVDYLKEQRGFKHFSVRDFIVEEIKRRKLPVNRDNMVKVANELRAQNSPSYIVDELYKEAKETGKNSIIESIRTYGEIESLRKKGNFILIAVDADRRTRYERIRMRGSETDRISFEKFMEDEAKEMNASDPNKQNLKRCIEEADYLITNDKSFKDLYVQINEILNQLANST
jgi:dephospho-CoA kinase